MGDFSTEPSSTISVDDARRLIGRACDGCGEPAVRIEYEYVGAGFFRCKRHSRPPLLTRLRLWLWLLARRLARDPKWVSLALLGAWLGLPRDSTAGFLCLLGGVAVGTVAYDQWRGRRRR